MDHLQARDILLSVVKTVGTEQLPLEVSYGRVLAEPLVAAADVPPFDRSAYDGYVCRAEDVRAANRDHPVTLAVIGEIAAGEVFPGPLTAGTAARIMTGAPIPEGGDCVIMYEKTSFTQDSVTLYSPLRTGENIVRAGEDVRAGTCLAEAGTVIDSGLAGELAAQDCAVVTVYRRPAAGLICTGSEIAEPGQPLEPGQIRNSNRYAMCALLEREGCRAVYLGSAADSTGAIEELIRRGLDSCDIVFLTGGVSAGDHDLTPDAMRAAGCEILVHGVDIKPGMACCYGTAGGKAVLGLSGNPASALTNYYAVVRPALRRLCGILPELPEELELILDRSFGKASPQTRFLRGSLVLEDGQAKIRLPGGQGNAVLSSVIGMNVMAVIPAGSGPIAAGSRLKGMII